MKRALVTFAVLFCAGCNNSTDVGSPCTVTADCDPAHYCVTTAPGGFCTRGCTFEGRKDECPGGSVCAYIGGTVLVCAPICTSTSQCRDKYDCNTNVGTDVRSCTPTK